MCPLPINPFFFFTLRFTLLLPCNLAISAFSVSSHSQENPQTVPDDHNLGEPGSWEVRYLSTFGTQRGGSDFHAYWAGSERGAAAGTL